VGIIELLAIILVFAAGAIVLIGPIFLSEEGIRRIATPYWDFSPELYQAFLKQKAIALSTIVALFSGVILQASASAGHKGFRVNGWNNIYFAILMTPVLFAVLFLLYKFVYGYWFYGGEKARERWQELPTNIEMLRNPEDGLPGRHKVEHALWSIDRFGKLLGKKYPDGFHQNCLTPEDGEKIYLAFERKHRFYCRFHWRR
jgi:hypothetical protein